MAPEARAAVEASGTISGWTVYSKERTLATLESGVVVQATRGHVVQTILNIAEVIIIYLIIFIFFKKKTKQNKKQL